MNKAGKKAIPQGKSHVRFYEYEKKLYFATHCNIYESIDGIPGLPQHIPDGYSPYPGGHILSYDLATYYLTGGPIPADEKQQEGAASTINESGSVQENLHLVTYHLPTFHYQDHGPIYYADGTRPSHVNSIAVSADRTIYALARFNYEGHAVQDLIKITPLLSNP